MDANYFRAGSFGKAMPAVRVILNYFAYAASSHRDHFLGTYYDLL
jgi:hypothetical protein